MLKRLSVKKLSRDLLLIVQRFPLQTVLLLLGAGIWWAFTGSSTKYPEDAYITALALILALYLLSIAVDVWAEKAHAPVLLRWASLLTVTALAAGLYLHLSPMEYQTDAYRIALIVLASLLIAISVPFHKNQEQLKQWLFVRVLISRMVVAAACAFFLYLGIALALFSFENLFALHLKDDLYLQLFGVTGITVTGFLFLAGIPNPAEWQDGLPVTTAGLQRFSKYILFPLILLYCLILASYMIKILLAGELPEGGVSLLVLGHAGLGLIAYLLIYPVEPQDSKTLWLWWLKKIFFFCMIPFLALLFIATWTRVQAYGITEQRYFLMALFLWLSGITLYCLSRRKPALWVISASFAAVVILSTYGPQSASSVAKKSQIKRYERFREAGGNPSEQAAIVQYLIRHHGPLSIQPLTTLSLSPIYDSLALRLPEHSFYQLQNSWTDSAYTLLQLPKNEIFPTASLVEIRNQSPLLEIQGFDYQLSFNASSSITSSLGGRSITLNAGPDSLQIQLEGQETIIADLKPFFRDMLANIEKTDPESAGPASRIFSLPQQQLQIQLESRDYLIRLQFTQLTLQSETDKDSFNNAYQGIALIKRKK